MVACAHRVALAVLRGGQAASAESCTHPAKRDHRFPPPVAERQRLPNVRMNQLAPCCVLALMMIKISPQLRSTSDSLWVFLTGLEASRNENPHCLPSGGVHGMRYDDRMQTYFSISIIATLPMTCKSHYGEIPRSLLGLRWLQSWYKSL